ncbi:DUF6705 family protein [Psychroserpens sp.]|uniref:DUF6705 family protein n=1 Tax=Psychroserpens sp. TaxID=2020870 RepID=UPI001B19A448|nr:DUF6705 family protein [Psychroserpens sp.]MBO6605317.1 hypothetical protein [Psychroserpens sp.]MBO6630000.1 hypothetical protein [Psychroserpens sp.]MBO6653874.1 hypothetical protein [Psychroserpens sp.]MBO6682195.1 hypothetical protein [Psychroserpens sp.]MBO6748691.1 hypothetical protein [Psychroserpens sp.]
MKKILLPVLMCFLILNCKAQIISIQDANTYFLSEDEGIPDNVTAIKDLNNTLDVFVGNWSGVHENITYDLFIEKIESTLVDIPHDILSIGYKITNENGVVTYDTTNLTNNELVKISGNYFLNDGETYYTNYFGQYSNCGQFGNLLLNASSNNQLTVKFIPGRDSIDSSNCNISWSYPFPINENVVLLKQ